MRIKTIMLTFLLVLLAPAIAIAQTALPDGLAAAWAVLKAAKASGDLGLLTPLLTAFFALVLRHVIGLYHAWRPSTEHGRNFMPYICVAFGVAFLFFAHYWAGVNWAGAGTIGLAGPLALAWNELIVKHGDLKDGPPVSAVAAWTGPSLNDVLHEVSSLRDDLAHPSVADALAKISDVHAAVVNKVEPPPTTVQVGS